MAVVFINELLCFLMNKYYKFTKTQLKSTLLGFYTESELSEAKDILYNDAVKLAIENLPRAVKRAKSDSRVRLLADDLVDLCAFLDEHKAVDRLPVYVARHLDRVPTAKSEDMDLYCIATKLEELDRRMTQYEVVGVGSTSLMTIVEKVEDVCERIDTKVSSCNTVEVQEAQPPLVRDSSMDATGEEWTTVVRRGSDKPKSPPRSPPKSPPKVRVTGTKVITDHTNTISAIKVIPRQPILAAFVSRLHNDTKEEELHAYLEAAGMKGVVCRRLKPKIGQTFRTAAFYVSCSLESSDLFYNEASWPAGVEVRDWVYKH